MSLQDIKQAIRDVPDFPRKGVIFKDITPLLGDGALFKEVVDMIAARVDGISPDLIVGIEARGFIFSAALAYKLGVGLILVRKEGKLPYRTKKVSFDLEYGSAAVEIHEDGIAPGSRVLIVDDLLATGGTLSAAVTLVEHYGGEIVGIAVLIELDFLKGREKLEGYPFFSLIHY